MSKTIRISHSSINAFSQCGKRYKLHYLDKLRSKVMSGALLFGRPIDTALNHLVTTKNLEESKSLFEKAWRFQDINKVGTYLPYATNVAYAARDFDSDFITDADEKKFHEVFSTKFNFKSDKSLKQLTSFYRELKKENGFNSLTDDQKRIYNYGHWICLLNKGLVMLDGYNRDIIPRIKEVLAVQKRISIKNSVGDEIIGFVDLIARLDDNKVYIIDNKTSSIEFERDSAGRSQQLILYYHAEKDEYKAEGVAFFVIPKQPDKNKVKTCSKCQFDGSGTSHRTCFNEIEGVRCKGAWKTSIKPSCRIDAILNDVTEAAENLVLDTFDENAQAIKKGVFSPNLSACGTLNSGMACPFLNLCWKGKDSDIFKMGDNKE